MNPQDILNDIQSHQWLALAVLLTGYFGVIFSEDSTFPAINVPLRWKPVLVIALGQAYAVLEAVTQGSNWFVALKHGLSVAFVTMGLGAALKGAFFPDGAPATPSKIQAILMWFLKLAMVANPSKSKSLRPPALVTEPEKPATPPTPPPLPLLLLMVFTLSCTPAQLKTAETVAIDLTNAVCTALEQQTEPSWITYACVLDQAINGNLKSVTLRVAREGAPAFAAAHTAKSLDAGAAKAADAAGQ